MQTSMVTAEETTQTGLSWIRSEPCGIFICIRSSSAKGWRLWLGIRATTPRIWRELAHATTPGAAGRMGVPIFHTTPCVTSRDPTNSRGISSASAAVSLFPIRCVSPNKAFVPHAAFRYTFRGRLHQSQPHDRHRRPGTEQLRGADGGQPFRPVCTYGSAAAGARSSRLSFCTSPIERPVLGVPPDRLTRTGHIDR